MFKDAKDVFDEIKRLEGKIEYIHNLGAECFGTDFHLGYLGEYKNFRIRGLHDKIELLTCYIKRLNETPGNELIEN